MEQSSLDDLRALLTRVRRRWITASSMRAGAHAASVALALLVVVLATDRFLRPADVVMVVLAVAACLGALAFAIRTLWPLRRTPSDRQVARFIEERCPDLEDRMASATEIAGSGQPSALGGLVLLDAAEKARSVDVDRIVALDHVRGSILRGAVATVALFVALVAGSGSVSRIARTAFLYAFPYTVTLEIQPGEARVVAGESVAVVARLGGTIGVPARTPPSVMITDVGGRTHAIDMDATGREYRAVMPPITADVTYRVRAGTLVSDEYSITALFPPRVDEIDVAYQYPAFTQLPPRVATDGGDVYAPAGTQVTLTVRTDKAVSRGALDLEAGGRVSLAVVDDRTLQTSFTVSRDDSYRVVLVDNDGLPSPADIDYFIRTVLDRPPEVEITRPTGDLDITPLEETVIEATARDDFGLERFELVYTVVGERERSVDLLTGGPRQSAAGRYTVYGEELELEPGDFITYYARALDTNTGERAGEVRSDIYFLQVRPFDQEFEGAQSQAASSMDASELGDLAELQKQIIVATWRLDGETGGSRRSSDLDVVADAQEDLRRATTRQAQQILDRDRRSSTQTGGRTRTEVQALRDATVAMMEAETRLRAEEASRAVFSEMDALNHLLRAEAEVRRSQVSTPQGGASGAGQSRAREDLSALFDQELRRDQQTNYETRSTSSVSDDRAGSETEVQRRLRELAARQQDLNRDQAVLADSEAEVADEDRQRQLDRLTREQNQIRAELEGLARDLEWREQSDREQPPDGAAEISERMRRATSALSRGDVAQAAHEGQQAAERLQEMQRQLGQRSGGGGRAAVGELQLEATQLSDQQRQLALDARQSGRGPGGEDTRARLATRGDRLADRVDSLEDRLEDLLPRTLNGAQRTLRDALEDLRTANVAEETRALADRLRRPTGLPELAEAESEVEAIAAEINALAEALDQVAERLATGRAQSQRAQRLAEALEEAQAVRRSLDTIDAQLRKAADGGGPGPETPAATQNDDSTESQSETGSAPSVAGSPSPGQTGSDLSRELATLQQRLLRQLEESTQILEELKRQRPGAEEDLERWVQQWQSGPAQGIEPAKLDFSAWESLRSDLLVALEALEASRARELRREEIEDRLTVGPSEQMPDAYRRLVERYYRSLANHSERP